MVLAQIHCTLFKQRYFPTSNINLFSAFFFFVSGLLYLYYVLSWMFRLSLARSCLFVCRVSVCSAMFCLLYVPVLVRVCASVGGVCMCVEYNFFFGLMSFNMFFSGCCFSAFWVFVFFHPKRANILTTHFKCVCVCICLCCILMRRNDEWIVHCAFWMLKKKSIQFWPWIDGK